MSVSITTYGNDKNYWNAGPGDAIDPSNQILINTNSSASQLNFSVTSGTDVYTGIVKGNFQFNGPISTLDKVSGTLNEFIVYKNGLLCERDLISQGTDLKNWVVPTSTSAQYLSQASTLDSGITFVGSQGTGTWGDTLIGGISKDVFTSYAGNKKNPSSYFDGKQGVDTAIMQGKLSEYKIETTSFTDNADMSYTRQISGWTATDSVANRNGLTQMVNVERLQFSDTMLALDTGKDQTAGSGYMLYKAAFNRSPDVGGLGFWISKMDGGMTLNTVAKNFVISAEFQAAYGGSNPSVNTLVTKLYNNVLNRTPDAGGLAFWQDKLSNGGWSNADVLSYFSTSAENVANVTPLIANGIAYQQFVG